MTEAKSEPEQFSKYLVVKPPNKELEGKGMVRIDSAFAKRLGLTPGVVVEITNAMPKANRSTAAILLSGRVEDASKNIIRLGHFLGRNLGIQLNQYVTVRKIEPKPAEKVMFKVFPKSIELLHPQGFTTKLKGKILTKDDVISFRAQKNGKRIDIVVEWFLPQCKAVVVNEGTEIKLRNAEETEQRESYFI